MESFLKYWSLFFHLILFVTLYGGVQSVTADSNLSEICIGAVYDPDSSEGTVAEISMALAISDFYRLHSDYQTRLLVQTRYVRANDTVGTAAAVVDLLKDVEVHAIIGSQISYAAPFVIKLGEKAHVPIISFFETSLTLISPNKKSYFIRVAQDDSIQVKAIAAILQEFNWHEASLVYEDTDFGHGIISYLVEGLQEKDIRVTHMSLFSIYAEDFQISRELNLLMTKQTRVFIVHMTASLGARLFTLANKAGMMSEGYVWLITTGMSNSLTGMEAEVIDSMEGVLGIRSFVPKSKDLESFNVRWKRKLHLLKPNSSVTEPNIFGLWAYDTIWAIAGAVERTRPTNSRFLKPSSGKSSTDFASFGISSIGPRLANEILNSKFEGLSGGFRLVNGQLESSAFEIFNVIGKSVERVVGYWSPDKGIAQNFGPSTSSRNKLKNIIWPGDSINVPKGWAIPKLKIGIPVKVGFKQFVDMHEDPRTKQTIFSGFSIDVFRAALEVLEFNISCDPEFVPFMNDKGETAGTYDNLLYEIYNKSYDAVVGDSTIVANRTLYVDFTLPYSESGVTMLVTVKHDKHMNMWVFLQPWGWDLWLAIFVACIFVGLVIRIIERETTEPEPRGPSKLQLVMIVWFPLYFLALPQRELVTKDSTRFLLVIWISLGYIGYQYGSFVRDFLVHHLNFNESKLKSYHTIQEYQNALHKGSENGGVAAIFDEIPYIRVFLAKYGSEFMMAGPKCRTDGFGFAFRKGSPLVSYFSWAILKVREQEKTMDDIEKRYFGQTIISLDQAFPISADGSSSSLRAYSLGGLFIILGIVALSVLIISEYYTWWKPVALAKEYVIRYLSSPSSNGTGAEVVAQSTVETDADTGNLPDVEDSGNSEEISGQVRENIPAVHNEEKPQPGHDRLV